MDELIAATEGWIGYAALAAVVVLTFLSLRTSSRKLRSSGSSKDFAQDQIARLRDQDGVRGDMEQLLVELQELSREINAQIDTKFAKLEFSIRQADERIVELEQLIRTSAGHQAIDTIVDDDDPAAARGSRRRVPDPENDPIYELADDGLSARQIAQQTGRTTGEVELILALRGHAGGRRKRS